MHFDCQTADEAFRTVGHALLTIGSNVGPRGFSTKEILDVNIRFTRPWHNMVTGPLATKRDYLLIEHEWYESGSLKPPVGVKQWAAVVNEKGQVASNYGRSLWKWQTPDGTRGQLRWAVREILKDPDTRRAVVTFNETQHRKHGIKDFPCTMYAQFFLRNRQLEMHVHMRSNDLVWGFRNDFPFFSNVQQWVARELDRQIGSRCKSIYAGALIHNAGSMHVYERHWKALQEHIDTPPITRDAQADRFNYDFPNIALVELI